MYKNSSDQQNFINRVASHSTKESRTGRIDAIPSWAQEPEQYYNSLRDRWRVIHEQLTDAQTKLTNINLELKKTLPFKEFEHHKQHKERLAARVTLLIEQQKEYRALAIAAGEQSWTMVFFHVAKKLLSPEDFALLINETKLLLGRNEREICGGRSMMSEQARDTLHKREKRRHRRVNWNKSRTGSVTVWADNRPVKEQYKIETQIPKDK